MALDQAGVTQLTAVLNAAINNGTSPTDAYNAIIGWGYSPEDIMQSYQEGFGGNTPGILDYIQQGQGQPSSQTTQPQPGGAPTPQQPVAPQVPPIDVNNTGSIQAAGNAAVKSSAPPYSPLIEGSPDSNGTPGAAPNEAIATYQQEAYKPGLNPATTLTYNPIPQNSNQILQSPGISGQPQMGVQQATAGQAQMPQISGSSSYQGAGADYAKGTIAPGSQYGATTGQAGTGQATTADQYNATNVDFARDQTFSGSQYTANQSDTVRGTVNPESLVQNQFNDIMNSAHLDPNGVPDWARTAVTASNQRMNSLGLSGSTMAGNASTAAILNAAMPMAQANAKVVADVNTQNINNAQQVMLTNTAARNAASQYNAGVIERLNNLIITNAQQSIIANGQWANTASQYNASVNAQFDLNSINNLDQMSRLNVQQINAAAQYSAKVVADLNQQTLLNQQQTFMSNQAAENAARQFNATSEQQNQQFFSSIAANINAQNADRATAVSQFNAGQINAVGQFIANLASQREEFNSTNQLQINQSNVQWQRTLATADTAGQNAANQANVQNLFNVQQNAQNNLWQQARDEASWALTAGENSQNRELSLVNSSLNRQTSLEILASTLNANMFSQLGSLAGNLLNGGLGKSLGNSLFGSSGSSSDNGGSGGDFGGGGDGSFNTAADGTGDFSGGSTG